jgi:uncharacterized membrane protein YoaT (DUF817 family)
MRHLRRIRDLLVYLWSRHRVNHELTGVPRFALEFLGFGFKNLRACVFAGTFFAVLYLSGRIPLFGLARYDFLLFFALAFQALLVRTKIETMDELKSICVFHVLGVLMEIFKTSPQVGSWAYPGPGFFKIMNVPVYSGFMYAAVASYMIQAWRLFDIKIIHHPPFWQAWVLAMAIYVNFFAHHYLVDVRWPLVALTVFLFRKSDVYFTPLDKVRRMPQLMSFVLIGFFIWLAENIGTFMGAWKYPNQLGAWSAVHVGKWSSWSLLVIMSFIIIANLKHIKASIVVEEARYSF